MLIQNFYFLQSLKSFLGEDKLKEFINFTLHYIADLDIPIKRLFAQGYLHRVLKRND